MRLSVLPALAFALAVPLQVLCAHTFKLPGTNTTFSSDNDCLSVCVYGATSLHQEKQGNCTKGSQLQQQKCACTDPFLGDVTQCMQGCIVPASKAQDLVYMVYKGCAEVLATSAAPPAVCTLAPSLALALSGLVVAVIYSGIY